MIVDLPNTRNRKLTGFVTILLPSKRSHFFGHSHGITIDIPFTRALKFFFHKMQ